MNTLLYLSPLSKISVIRSSQLATYSKQVVLDINMWSQLLPVTYYIEQYLNNKLIEAISLGHWDF